MILDKKLASPSGSIKYKTVSIKKVSINLSNIEKLNVFFIKELLFPNRNNIKLE